MPSIANNPVVNYVKESREELKKVAWPTKNVVVRDTFVVVAVSLSMAVFFGVIDFGLSKGLERLLAL